MKRFFLSLVLSTSLITSSPFIFADDTKPVPAVKHEVKDVAKYMLDIAVTIKAGNAQGSGSLKVTKDGQVWVWTAGHVVAGLRHTRNIVDEKGAEKTVVEFDDAQVVRFIVKDGRKVGSFNLDAEVMRYSDANNGEDLALLRIRGAEDLKVNASVNFYLDKDLPTIGTKLYHCGSLLGEFGSNSLTNGLMSQLGRVYQNKVYDQTSCTAFPGSSGGPVCIEADGRYVGMLTRGAGETFNLIVPVRRMHTWAKQAGVEFAMDDSLTVPSDEELYKKPIEVGGKIASVFSKANLGDDSNEDGLSFKIKKLK